MMMKPAWKGAYEVSHNLDFSFDLNILEEHEFRNFFNGYFGGVIGMPGICEVLEFTPAVTHAQMSLKHSF